MQRYDAIAPPHHAGMKTMPKAIRAAVAPQPEHPDRTAPSSQKQPAKGFRDWSRNGRSTARELAACDHTVPFDLARMQLSRVSCRSRSLEVQFKAPTEADLDEHCLRAGLQGWSTEHIAEWITNAIDHPPLSRCEATLAAAEDEGA